MPERIMDNALDSMLHAACLLWDEGVPIKRRLKYSTIELFQGIELLLKARLCQDHWTLVLADPAKFGQKPKAKELFEAGDFASVNYDAARDRLGAFCSVLIGPTEDGCFQGLKKLRNRYVHFFCDEPEAQVRGTQLRAWHHALRLIERGVLGEMAEAQGEVIREISGKMLQSEQFLDERLAQAGETIELERSSGFLVATCPMCERPALVIGDGNPRCHVCGDFEMCPVSAADAYGGAVFSHWRHPKDGADHAAAWCEECGSPAVVPAGQELIEERLGSEPETDEAFWVCFQCGEFYAEADMMRCPYCGDRYAGATIDRDYCPGCRESIRERVERD